MAAEVNPAIQVDGVTPTVTPIADVEMFVMSDTPLSTHPPSPTDYLLPDTPLSMANSDISVSSVDHRQDHQHLPHSRYTALQPSRSSYLRSNSRSNPGSPDGASPRAPKQGKPTGVFGKNYRHRRPDQPRPTAPPPPLSRQILAVNVANISNKRPCYPPYRQENTRLWAISETCITSSKFRFTVPGFDVIQHPATGPGRRGIALGIPSCFGGHEHGSAVGTMILAKVPNFTPECLWIVGSVYVGHSGATTNYSRREAFASIRQALDRVVPFDNTILFSYLETGTPTHSAFSASSTRGVMTVHQIDTDTDTDSTQLTSQFLESANAVADQLESSTLTTSHSIQSPAFIWHNQTCHIGKQHCTAAFISAATNRNPDPVQCNTLRDEWSRLKAAATQLERVDGRKQWAKHADNLDRAVSDGRTDLVFAAARAMSGNSSRSAAVTPLYNSDGVVQYDPTSIMRVMQGHYGSLAADTTGHSLDLQYWHDRQPIQVSPNTPPIRNSDILDQDFSWNQIAAASLQMSPRKAPGGRWYNHCVLPSGTLHACQHPRRRPTNSICSCSVRVCGQVFASATIPRAWLCASIVSHRQERWRPSQPRRQARHCTHQCRLETRMQGAPKCALSDLSRPTTCCPTNRLGFRKREECVGQVVSLVDIIQRRQNAGINTHVLFIDIRKAFDTVPVGALLWKLQNMGFPRRTLAFLKALYTSSSARARAGSLLSDPFPVQRGVRQGCPLSGLLFNLFINDILDGVAPITVPGLPRDTNPIRGLMYADDVAVFADSEQSLLAASTAIEQWANRWEMQFGVAKCGIISFTGHLAPRLDNPLDIRLHGQLLDHSAWLKQKRSALEHTISALHPVLANHQLTVNYRSRIFSAVVMDKAYYGLELVGGNKSHLAPLQTTINKGIRLFTGARLSTAIGPLLVETGIGSLLTRSLVSRVRLLERSVTKKTPINAICSGTDNDVFT
ncbi:hypothetical protein BASA83_013600 [Batrachochytrium salamandrivorans]|nr:hypothetical protein BASA83_013600 [Batrachochytrium salamandrivorans]